MNIPHPVLLGLSGVALTLGSTTLPITDAASPRTGVPAPTGALLSWGDYDADGLDDAYAIRLDGRGSLLRNLGDGSLRDVTVEAGLDAVLAPSFASWRDVDGDGALDLFVGTRAGAHLFRSLGGGAFQDVAGANGLALEAGVENAHWLDYDADGRDDLHVRTVAGDVLFHGLAEGRFERTELPVASGAVGTGPFVSGPLTSGAFDARSSAAADLARPADAERGPRRSAAPRNARGSITGATGGADVVVTNPGGVEYVGGGFGNFACPEAIVDQADGMTCMNASSVPTLGMLHPLSNDFNVTPDGRTFIGTTTLGPSVGGTKLKVVGDPFVNGVIDVSSDLIAGVNFSDATEVHWGIGKAIDNNFYIDEHGEGRRLTMLPGGNVGIGTSTPSSKLTVQDGSLAVDLADGPSAPAGSSITLGRAGGEPAVILKKGDGAGGTQQRYNLRIADSDDSFRITGSNPSSSDELMLGINASGNVGIGTANPTHKLSVQDGSLLVDLALASGSPEGSRIFLGTPSGDPGIIIIKGDGAGNEAHRWDIRHNSPDNSFTIRDSTFGADRLTIDTAGLVSVKQSLEIRGGADIVERFESSCGPLEPGTVVVIDPESPGALACSSDAYDTKVAGVVSGAGGVNPGLCLGQDGVLDGETPVAMTGRVYVKCSTENGAIRPGDRLTTAALAGHAMKVTDEQRSVGAVIGKAMSSLDEDTGLVLVLVNLQ